MASLLAAGSRQTQTATLPPGQFHCLLDELPLHLIPRHALHSQTWRRDLSQPLFLNPHCSVLSPGQLPAELESQRHLLEGFHLQHTLAWVCDPPVASLHPFWLGGQTEAAVMRLRSGEPASSLPEDVRFLLARAGLLAPEGHAERRRAAWNEIVGRQAPLFKAKGYAPLRSLIHPYHVAALRRYYRHAIRRRAIRLGDEQSSRRYVAHNESVARFFHHQMAKAVSAVVGEPVKPSYVYLASYLSGAELKKHTDREQCEFSVTLCLDFSPEPDLETPWPIRLDVSGGSIALYQALGDGLLYRGMKLPHSRRALAKGYTSTSIFFHYVPQDFSGPLD